MKKSGMDGKVMSNPGTSKLRSAQQQYEGMSSDQMSMPGIVEPSQSFQLKAGRNSGALGSEMPITKQVDSDPMHPGSEGAESEEEAESEESGIMEPDHPAIPTGKESGTY